MKKSCSAKEFKVATTSEAETNSNVTKEIKEELTEEQLLINQKLLESGIYDEGLGWTEKKNILKTINVSLGCGQDKSQRNRSHLFKTAISKIAKWMENGFEVLNHDDLPDQKTVAVNSIDSSECTSNRNADSVPLIKRSLEETEESLKNSNHCEIRACESKEKYEVNIDISKSSKKVHIIKIHLEEDSKSDSALLKPTVKQEESGVSLGKKRASHSETDVADSSKKLKMDETNKGVSSEEETTLAIELEIQRNKNITPFELRDVKAIVSDCDFRNKKWKETFAKFKLPTRWDNPIVKTCEKWDGKYVPPKLLYRYQRYLCSKNMTHPVFLPVKPQTCVDSNLDSEINSQPSENSECKNDSGSDYNNCREGSFVLDMYNGTGPENNLNASGSCNDSCGRMVLRNRNQSRKYISDEENSSDGSDDWIMTQKSSKKPRVNSKNKRAAEQNNKQLVVELEKCNLNKGSGTEGNRRNGNKIEVDYSGESVMSTNAFNRDTGPDPDTMVCPICSLRFKKQLIEGHATECASKTYKD